MRQKTLHNPARLTAVLVFSGLVAAAPVHAQSSVSSSASAKVSTSAAVPRIVLVGKTYTPASAALAPYRDSIDGQICISPEALSSLGVVYVNDDRMRQVTFSIMGGESTTTVPGRTGPDGKVAVPLAPVIEGLGGECDLDAGTNTLYCRAVLTSVDILGGQLRLRATLPVTPRVTTDNGGRKFILDFDGAAVGKLPKSLNLNAPAVSQARSGQFQENTARIVLELKDATGFRVLDSKPSTLVVMNPAPLGVGPARVTNVTPLPPSQGTVPAPPAAPTGRSRNTQVSNITFKPSGDNRAQFVIKTGRAPVTRTTMAQNRLTLDLLNADLAPTIAASLASAKHPFLKAVSVVTQGNVARLVLDLTRAVSFVVKPSINGQVTLDLNLPKSAGGTLAGKLIVVDAGHGGTDSGATGSGFREKDVTLAVSLQVADALRDAGANVLLTRPDDNFISVNERPRIANRAAADFFISIHADSAGNRSATGSTVYFHAADPNCRTLARCIADRFQQMGGIRSRGTGTDYTRFPGAGYGVLRGSRMVGVLVECGFMSNGGDVRKLVQSDMQRRIAENIVSGLRDYIEGNPNVNYGSNNPNVGPGAEFPPAEVPEPVVEQSQEGESDTPPTPDVMP